MKVFFASISLFFVSCMEKKFPGVEVVYKESSLVQGNVDSLKTYKVAVDRLRADLKIKSGPGLVNLSMFFQSSTQKLFIVVWALKKIVKNPDLNLLAKAGRPFPADMPLKKSAESKKVAGVGCTIYRHVKNGVLVSEACVATTAQMGLNAREGEVFSQLATRLAKALGFVFDTDRGVIIENKVFDERGELIYTSVLESVKKLNIAESDFNVPKDFEVENFDPSSLFFK